MPALPDSGATAWRSSLKRLADDFDTAAEEYRRDHDGLTVDLALFHYDQKFRSLSKEMQKCAARQFVADDATSLQLLIDAYAGKRDCAYLWSNHGGSTMDWTRSIQRTLCSNLCLRTNVEIELGNVSPEEFNKRTERHQRRFNSLIEKAGHCLTFLPFDWNGRFEEASLCARCYRWVWCLFDIAWKRLPGVMLNATRDFAFKRSCSTWFSIMPYAPESFQTNWDDAFSSSVRQRKDGSTIPDRPKMPTGWKEQQPECYFSILRDFYGQSVHFIDWLLSVEEKSPTGGTVGQRDNPPKRKRGRPEDSVASNLAFDKRVFEAHESRMYRNFTELAGEFKIEGFGPEEARLAKERHRDRLRGKSGINRVTKRRQAK